MTSSTNFGSSIPCIITMAGAIPQRSILSLWLFIKFFIQSIWTIAKWFHISRRKLLTRDGISSGLIFSINLLLSDSSFSLNNLRPLSAQFISCFRSFIWKLCASCSEKNSIFWSAKAENSGIFFLLMHCFISSIRLLQLLTRVLR